MVEQHHIPTLKFNLQIFATLVGLTLLTAGMDYLPLGPFNLVVALVIACTKAMLVILYFMHLRWSGKLTWAFSGLSLFFLLLLIGMTFDDFLTRNWTPQPHAWVKPFGEVKPPTREPSPHSG